MIHVECRAGDIKQLCALWRTGRAGGDPIGKGRHVRPAEEPNGRLLSSVKELAQLVVERDKRARKEGYSVSNEKATDLREAEAWLAFAKGKSDEAIVELRAAAAHQDKGGGESVSVPAREMLADMLVELKRPAEAIAEYKTALKNSPNRFDSLYGAMRAAASINTPEMHAAAESYLTQFMNCCGFGGDRPEIKEASKYISLRQQEVLPQAIVE